MCGRKQVQNNFFYRATYFHGIVPCVAHLYCMNSIRQNTVPRLFRGAYHRASFYTHTPMNWILQLNVKKIKLFKVRFLHPLK